MENRSNVFQLAHPKNQYQRSYGKSRSPLTHLPFIITQEDGPQPIVVHSSSTNIFKNCSDSSCRQQGLQTIGYHSVGNKQLKSYASKLQKRRRHMNSMVKRSTQSNLSLSRSSQIRVPQERYLTKEEVLNKSRTTTMNQSSLEETYQTNVPLTFNQNTTLSTNKNHTKSHQDHFSIRKVLNKMKFYQKGWERQTVSRANTGSSDKRFHHQSSSILLDVEKYRNKVENNLQNNLENNRETQLQPKLWNKILRNYTVLNGAPEKKPIQRVVRGGIQTSGRGKLRKQISWLQQKDRQGHFFKLQGDLDK